jgi:hypothetical protein
MLAGLRPASSMNQLRDDWGIPRRFNQLGNRSSHHHDPGQPAAPEEALLQRMTTEPSFMAQVNARMHPGMLLVVTDLATSPDRRTGSDFVVMADADPNA